MTRCRLTAVLMSIVCLMPSLCFGQETSSGSSSSSSSEPAVVTEDRTFRLKGFVEGLGAAKIVDAQFAERRATFFRKRAQYRSVCRDDIRRANKTTLMKTLLRCYGSEMSFFKDFLGKEKEELQGTAGLSPTIRSAAVNRLDLLTDAIGTVIFAMDSGVYATKDDALEVKRNLYQKYELPLLQAWMSVRADRTLTWIAYMIANIDRLSILEHAVKLDRPTLSDARVCLVMQEAAINHVLKADVTEQSQNLAPALREVETCVQKMQGIPRALDGSGALLTP